MREECGRIKVKTGSLVDRESETGEWVGHPPVTVTTVSPPTAAGGESAATEKRGFNVEDGRTIGNGALR